MSVERERELFEQCLALDSGERDALLEQACPDDHAMRERVRRMLERHSDTAARESGFLRLDGSDPERIGPYRILQRLGEGGMGIVYAAEQREPMRRRVAVKVLRAGHGSREVLARFEAERQALALMTHPNIARILDAGTTADHRPYIVMEFVPGEPITRYCTQHDLPLRDRLLLLRSVCEAVQHAHQKGVIHRDLKPSNILVAEDGGRPLAKIIDFGIAKAVAQKLTDHTLETRVGSLLGTPDYMSPEQAELSPLDVDTRADVYALGAVLYQLLTGVPPLELAGSGAGYGEVQRRIQEQDPPAPSQRLDREAGREVRGELDWITLKALEKDRNRRYATAAELAADITRYLDGDAPLAGPRTMRYRVAKFARKHAFAVSALSAVFLLVAAFALLMSWQVRQTTLERDRANREAALSTSVTAFMLDIFKASNPGSDDAGKVTARELLDRGRAGIAGDTALDPEVRRRLLLGLGGAYRSLGLPDEAIPLLREVLQGAVASGDLRLQLDVTGKLGLALGAARRTQEARDTLRAALDFALAENITDSALLFDIRRGLATVERDLSDFEAARSLLEPLYAETVARLGAGHRDALDVGARLVQLYWTVADFERAETLSRELLPVAERALGKRDPLTTYLRGNLGVVYMYLDKWTEAERINREVYEIFVEQFGADGMPTQHAKATLAVSLPDRAAGLRMLADLERQQRAQFGADHPQLIDVLQNTGWVHSRMPGHEVEAERYYAAARALAERHQGETHQSTLSVYYDIAALHARTGRGDSAMDLLRRIAQGGPAFQFRAARDPDFDSLRGNPEFNALLGRFAATE